MATMVTTATVTTAIRTRGPRLVLAVSLLMSLFSLPPSGTTPLSYPISP